MIPILVRPVDRTTAPIARLQALPTDANPLTMWENKDAALADITAGLRRIIAEELPQLTASAPRAALPPIWNIAYRFHQDYQAVLCARAESAKTIVSSYVAIASLLQLPEREAKE